MRRGLLGVLAATSLMGCGGGGITGAVDPNAPATGPLTALAECAGPPGEPIDAEVAGVVLPPGSVVLESYPQEPLTFLTAYVDMTPVEIRLWFESTAEVQVLTSEDEIHEVEVLVSDGTHRTYVKGGAVCQTGTTLNVVVGQELEGGAEPAPDGAFSGDGGSPDP